MNSTYYFDHTQEFRRELAETLDLETVKRLHEKRPWRHFVILLRQLLLLAGCEWMLATQGWTWWAPLPILVAGFTVFNFTVLLHEVIHHAVTERDQNRPVLSRFLSLLYAMPSGISASQFTQWHLDHHAGLGAEETDPKRHWLSPKKNWRLLKLCYFTVALFPIYFRAAAKENATYPPALQSRIRWERLATIVFQLSLLALAWWLGGFTVALLTYILPIFVVFPIAFALNRVGQHYNINPGDPANWSTLVRSSWFWNFAYLYSNFHLEHHYFPGVPFYNLPKLQKLLLPLYEKHGIRMHGYGDLFWGYIVKNGAPHTDWRAATQVTKPTTA